MLQSRGRNVLIIIACLISALTWTIYNFNINADSFSNSTTLLNKLPSTYISAPEKPPQEHTYTQTLVVARTKKEDTKWVSTNLPTLKSYVYTADDPTAALHPPTNKGHETMVYLTYIIDHYHNLTDITIFTHASRTTWHNNDLLDFDLVSMISSLSPAHVIRSGYFNLRCHPESGCPAHIQPFAPAGRGAPAEQRYFLQVWEELHGADVAVPETLATACCAQFAASREAITAIPLERWIHYRDWLINTKLDDATAGRIWEFTWQFVLTGKAVVCPAIEHCYCDGYGVCFQSQGEIWNWLAMKELHIVTSEVVKDMAERGKHSEELDFQKSQRIERPMNKWLAMAKLNGQDPYTRAFLSGRGDSWKEGDGF